MTSLLILGGSAAIFFALGQKDKPTEKTETAPTLPLVETAVVAEHHTGIDFESDGVVVPFQEVSTPAEVDGRIAYRSPKCRIGQVIKQGELLLRIADTDYKLKVQQLEQEYNQAQANLQELKVQAAAAQGQIALAEENVEIKSREIRRYESIQTNGAVSKSQLDTARLNEHAAKTELQSKRDSLELLLAQKARLENASKLASLAIEQARLDLSRTEIRAPINGVITQDPVVQDSYVNRGEVVAVIQDFSQMEVRCSIRMNEMEWLWQSSSTTSAQTPLLSSYRFPETPATVVYETESARFEWPATLQFFDGGKLSEITRLIPCRVTVNGDAEPVVIAKRPLTISPMLMSGMFVKVIVHASPNIPLLRLPESAVRPNGVVWVVRDQKLKELPVSVAYADENDAIVYLDRTGPIAGDQVVTSPLIAPVEDSSVEIVEARP
ncbi:HlyD family efflux transporter periplasmic adaptor subunit [Bremerella sp. JC817]|uniref:efflux RND transporter periplasmic adaptor subunit n=1 Tax=Bremerella sp. JC817 TaxID=3231756 RepID=UPI00345A4A43